MAGATPAATDPGPDAVAGPTPDAPVIEAIGLSKRYGQSLAVRDLTFEVRPGEVYGLLGPNGAGKTTTVLMLLGLTEPSGGRARVVGVDPTRDPLEVKRRVGYLPDSVGFYDDLTGRANLAYTARLNRVPRAVAADRIAGLLDQVGLADVGDHKVETYSRGMRQRLGIADALVKDPAVLILDEPTVSLDPEGVAELLALIARIAAERGIAILLSSHLLDQVQAVCHRVGIFYAGRLVADGTIADLAARGGDPGDTVEVAFAAEGGSDRAGEAGPPAGDLGRLAAPGDAGTLNGAAGDGTAAAVVAGLPGVASVDVDPSAPGRLLVRVARGGGPGLATALADAGLAPVHFRVREERLDAIYRRLIHAAADAAPGPGATGDVDEAPRPRPGASAGAAGAAGDTAANASQAAGDEGDGRPAGVTAEHDPAPSPADPALPRRPGAGSAGRPPAIWRRAPRRPHPPAAPSDDAAGPADDGGAR